MSRVPESISAQLAATRAVLARHLGDTLEAIHLFGSALDGGLQTFSDVDLMVTVSAPPTELVRHALMVDLLTVSAPPGTEGPLRALEVTVLVRGDVLPWRHPARRELQFGEWLRDDLQAGTIEPATLDHDLAILLSKVRQHSVALIGPPAAELFEPVPPADFAQALLDTVAQWNDAPDWQGDERNVVLALARIWFSSVTGGIVPKHVAADWALGRLPPEHRPVLANARDAYLGLAPDGLAGQAAGSVAAFVRHVRAEIERVA